MGKYMNLIYRFGLLLFLCLAPVWCSANEPSPGVNERPPNLIIVLTDDQGYADVGFNGCKDIATPNIDRIATEGVRFTSGYVTAAVCGPSRAGLASRE